MRCVMGALCGQCREPPALCGRWGHRASDHSRSEWREGRDQGECGWRALAYLHRE